MIIDIPPHIEQIVINQAEYEKLSVGELITKWANQNQAQTEQIQGLGDRIHQIFKQAEFAELDLPNRTETQRTVNL